MGGAVSSGQDNDELTDNLKEAGYIHSRNVERVFRIVDRAHYYLVEYKKSAYKDLAWKSGKLHLSAPCIYSEVMEALELEPGLSFLNLGSGTGYLNTMVGYMIGPYGINHGIELHEDNVTYAQEKLETLKTVSRKFDDLELCEPEFVSGNCLNLAPENRLYDRVYCGAACPLEQKGILQKMIKVGGILVVPVGDQLLKIIRIGEDEFSSANVLSVSFASLVVPTPSQETVLPIMLPEVNPLSLQSICRIAVRESIRKTFDFTPPPSDGDITITRHNRVNTRLMAHSTGPILPIQHSLMIMGPYDSSDVDDGDEEDEDEEERSDDDFLERQLQRHARELRRVRRRLTGNDDHSTDEIDSDWSEEEARPDKTLQEIPEAMESEDGATADDEKAAEPAEMEDGSGENVNKDSSEEPAGTGLVAKNNGLPGEMTGIKVRPPSLSFSSDNEEDSQPSSQPMAIQKAAPNPKLMYSTSADTSETSGFGSLGEEIPALGSQVSTDSLKDDPFVDSIVEQVPAGPSTSTDGLSSTGLAKPNGKAEVSNVPTDSNKAAISKLKSNKAAISKLKSKGLVFMEDDDSDDDDEEEEEEDEDLIKAKKLVANRLEMSSLLDESMDQVDDDDDNEDKYDGDNLVLDDLDDDSDDEERPPRGPDFTAFLKEKVETLPIPSSLKAYLLHYR